MTERVSMGDPARWRPLVEGIVAALVDHDLPRLLDWAPAYDVGRGVVLVTMNHPLAGDLLDLASDGVQAAIDRDGAGDRWACQHQTTEGLRDGHWVQVEPEWWWCAGCARAVLAQMTGDRRRCIVCDAGDDHDRLHLVRVPGALADEGGVSRHNLWLLLCPPCLGPVAIA